MTKQEFEALYKYPVTDKDYAVIETVYMWHPAAREKEDIAKLWHLGGIGLMMDMLPRANRLKDIDYQLRQHKAAIQRLEDEEKSVRYLKH